MFIILFSSGGGGVSIFVGVVSENYDHLISILTSCVTLVLKEGMVQLLFNTFDTLLVERVDPRYVNVVDQSWYVT